MESIPQIPKLDQPECPDTSHILNEEFKQYLCRDTFPKAIAHNLQTYHSECSELTACGDAIITTYNDMKLDLNELTHAETLVMESQAKYLMADKKQVTKLVQLFPDIDPNVVEKYSLIQTEDILPHFTERILNNKMLPERFLFPQPCKKFAKSTTVQEIKCLNLTDRQKQKLKLFCRTKGNCVFKIRKKKKVKNTTPVFTAEPPELFFENFELNVTYERQLVLRNVSAKSQRLRAPILPKTSKFYVKEYSLKSPIAPGMTASFKIGFSAEYFATFVDELVFGVVDSNPFIVQLISFRETPILKGLVYTDEDLTECNFYSQTFTDDVYNYTFDCGSTLIGQTMQVTIILQNCETAARYFIMSEYDWVFRDIRNVTDKYKLILPEFTISPVYFKLEKNEITELTINFNSTREGLCLDKLCLVCDNNSVQEIDIMGDCLLYKTCYFKFKMPDCPFPPIKKADEIKNILHLGAIYYGQQITATFSILNDSTLKIPFEWRNNKISKTKQFRIIQTDCIEIVPKHGYFLPLTETDFKVTVDMKYKRQGLYKHALSIYAIDIPETCLSEREVYTFGEEYRSKDFTQQLLTLLINEVEVLVHHIPISIRIYPEAVFLPIIKRKEEICKSTVKIVNEGFCSLCMQWIQKVKNSIHVNILIDPDNFELNPKDPIVCNITVNTDSYDDIEEIFTLSINEGFAERNLKISAPVEKPQIHVSKSFFEFGIITRGSNVFANFFVENTIECGLYWEVVEYQYDFENNNFMENNGCNLSCNCGELCHLQSYCDIEYKVDTSIPKKIFSLLVFYTIYKDIKQESSHVIILAEIHEPNILILNKNGDDTIFTIEEEFYINESETRTIQIYNNSLVDAHFKWGKTTEYHANFLDLIFDHKTNMCPANSRINVDMTMFFKKVGVIYDLYIPCWIQGKIDAVYLQIICKIKASQVVFRIPEKDNFLEIVWPYEFGKIPDYSSYSDLEEETTEVQELKEFDKHCTIINIMNYSEPVQCQKWSPDDVLEYLKGYENRGETISPYVSDIDTSSNVSLAPLHSAFESKTSLSDYVMEFYDIKCRQVFTQKIYISNNMQTSRKMFVSLKNFSPKKLHRKKIDDILIALKRKPEDKYSKQLTAHGIVILVEPITEELIEKSTTIIKISVYAETWGHYLEELKIKVKDIPTFYINLVIKVISRPIEYPILGKHLAETCDLIMRFGSILKCSKEHKRTIYIKNTSTIPHQITWHCLIKNMNEKDKPFNLLFDIFGFDLPGEEMKCKIKLMKYFGNEWTKKSPLFRVEPAELHLNPKETKQIYVYLNPKNYEHYFSKSNTEAILIGNLHVENKYSKRTNIFERNAEKDMPPLKISLHACLELPAFDFKHIRGSSEATLDANHILNKEKVKLSLRMVFKNISKNNLTVEMEIDEPFKIISMNSLAMDQTPDVTFFEMKKENKALISSEACMELLLSCEPSYEFVKKISLYLHASKFTLLDDLDLEVKGRNEIEITRNLVIHQDCVSQRIPVYLTMIFPVIDISTEYLDFGQVCLQSSKTLSLKILNKTASPTHFEITFDSPNEIFTVEPKKGFLQPSTAHDHSLYLKITFIPKDIIEYRQNLLILTKLPDGEYVVELVGNGIMDDKYFEELIFLNV